MVRTIQSPVQTQFYAFIARKGGVGKSTITGTIGTILADMGYRIALIEGDGQGSLSKLCGVEPHDAFYDLVVNGAGFNEVLVPVPEKFAGKNGELYLLSSSDAQMEIAADPKIGDVIYQRFQELRDWADFVLIDTSPNIDQINNAWFYVADWLILPTLCEKPSLDQLRDKTLVYIQRAEEAGNDAGMPVAKIRGILPNRYQAGPNVDKANLKILQKRHGNSCRIYPLVRDASIWNTAAQFSMSIPTMIANPPDSNYGWRKQAKTALEEIMYVVDSMIESLQVAAL